jgi:hypothetical protein
VSSWILDSYDQDRKMITLNTDIPLNIAKLVKGKEEENMSTFLEFVLAQSRLNLIFKPFNELCSSIDNKDKSYFLFYQD